MSKPSSYLLYLKWPIGIFATLFFWFIFSSNESESLDKSSYTTIESGSFLDPIIWAEKATANAPKTNCAISSEKELIIEHSVISNCQVTQLYGDSRLLISENGSLTVKGDLELFGNSFLEIGTGSLLTIHGNLTVSGNARVESIGNLHVVGTVITKGDGEVCGLGDAKIGGKVIGFGMCMELSTRFENSIKLNTKAIKNDAYQLGWSTEHQGTIGSFIISTSTNGMSYHEIERFEASENSAKSYSMEVEPSGLGTNYYRIEFINENGVLSMANTKAITRGANGSNSCAVIFSPDPCTPSCAASIVECSEGNVSVNILDAMGNVISEPLPKFQRDKALTYHVSNDNFLTPGIYMLPKVQSTESSGKKRIIK